MALPADNRRTTWCPDGVKPSGRSCNLILGRPRTPTPCIDCRRLTARGHEAIIPTILNPPMLAFNIVGAWRWHSRRAAHPWWLVLIITVTVCVLVLGFLGRSILLSCGVACCVVVAGASWFPPVSWTHSGPESWKSPLAGSGVVTQLVDACDEEFKHHALQCALET